MTTSKRDQLIAGTAIAASTMFAIARCFGWPTGHAMAQPGSDFKLLAWAPIRGLLAGYNVYADHGAYLRAYHVGLPASAHPPAVLLLLSPLAIPPLHTAWLLFTLVNIACIWLSLWLLARPTPGQVRGYALVGSLLVMSGFAEELLGLGQLTAVALLGLALTIRYAGRRLGVVGVALMVLVPQTGIPLSILLIRGRVRTVLSGWALAGLLSLVPLALLLHATGSVSAVGHSLRTTLTRPRQAATGRTDVLAAHLGHDLLVTTVLLVAAALVVLLARLQVAADSRLTLALLVTAVTALWYHQPYDLVLVGAVAGALVLHSRIGLGVAAGSVFGAGCVASSDLVLRPAASALSSGVRVLLTDVAVATTAALLGVLLVAALSSTRRASSSL